MAITLALNTAATSEPVSLEQARDYLRIDGHDEDALIDKCIFAARKICEIHLNRQLINATWVQTSDTFEEVITDIDGYESIVLPRPPLVSVTTLKYIDSDGNQQTWDSANYVVDTAHLPGRVYRAYDVTAWPTIRVQPAAVEVTYVAGFGATRASVPEDLQLSILMATAYLYENRDSPEDMPEAIRTRMWGSRAIQEFA